MAAWFKAAEVQLKTAQRKTAEAQFKAAGAVVYSSSDKFHRSYMGAKKYP